jgi:hypothetical protein
MVPIRQRARRILEAEFADAKLWGWKDPRTALTRPFWQNLVGDMRYVICVRNPSDVALSLAKRDMLSPGRAYRLWVLHMAALIAGTSGKPRIAMFYEDYFEALEPSLMRLARFIRGPEAQLDPTALELARAFVDQELWHHRSSASEFAEDAAAPLGVRSLYTALTLAGRRDSGMLAGLPQLDGLARALLPPGESGRADTDRVLAPLLLRDVT